MVYTYTYTYTVTIKVNQMSVNIYHTWILWDSEIFPTLHIQCLGHQHWEPSTVITCYYLVRPTNQNTRNPHQIINQINKITKQQHHHLDLRKFSGKMGKLPVFQEKFCLLLAHLRYQSAAGLAFVETHAFGEDLEVRCGMGFMTWTSRWSTGDSKLSLPPFPEVHSYRHPC